MAMDIVVRCRIVRSLLGTDQQAFDTVRLVWSSAFASNQK